MADVLTVLCYNTHVGTNLRGLRGLIAGLRHKPDLVLLQEVQSPLARARARRQFDPLRWSAVGTFPPSRSRGDSGTVIYARRARLSKIGGSNRLVTAYLDRWHPERRITVGRYRDKSTGRVLVACSGHTWAQVTDRPADRPQIARTHTAQVKRYAAVAGIAVRAKEVVIFAGDWNEKINGDRSTQVEQALSAVGLRLARGDLDGQERHLDEVFVNRGTAVNAFARHAIPGGEAHHKAIVIGLAFPVRAA